MDQKRPGFGLPPTALSRVAWRKFEAVVYTDSNTSITQKKRNFGDTQQYMGRRFVFLLVVTRGGGDSGQNFLQYMQKKALVRDNGGIWTDQVLVSLCAKGGVLGVAVAQPRLICIAEKQERKRQQEDDVIFFFFCVL